jgi:hypothetical protein
MDPSHIVIYSSYPSIDENMSGFSDQPENSIYAIYPNYMGEKPSEVLYAALSDWTASGYLLGMCSNCQKEATDTDPNIIDTSNGSVQFQNSRIVLFGGPRVNAPVYYYENRRLAPLYFSNINGELCWHRSDGVKLNETVMTGEELNSGQDMFMIESFIDDSNNLVFIVYGYGWKGTFAGGKFFKFVVYPNIDSYTDSYYVYKWVDTNGDGFVDLDEIITTPIIQG